MRVPVFLILWATYYFIGAPSALGDRWEQIERFFSPPENLRNELGNYRSPLTFADGTLASSAREWQRRRSEIRAQWNDLMGHWPPLITEPKVEVLEVIRRENFEQRRIRFHWTPEEFTTGYLLVPDGEGRRPAVLTLFYEPESAIGLGKPNRDFGLQLARRGMVVLSIGTTEATAAKTYALYYPNIDKAKVQPLSMLAYAAANAWHVLASLPEVDSRRIGVVGHSFGGKWAMFASCLFEKFACAAWSDPGIVFDESRPNVNYWEPWYLGYHPPPWRQRDDITEDNPARGLYPQLVSAGRDLHELHALMAPRPLLVSGGSEDPPERWVALNHTIAVNRLLGYENRVAMTNRLTHGPTDESNEVICAFFEHFLENTSEDDPVRPWSKDPWYWSFRCEPVLLLGGSDDDNLFQWPAEKLVPQLDRIVAAGGNVIRNTMSDRNDFGFEVYPFLQLENGKYDLNQWNPEYWRRFEQLLAETAKRKIVVQIEIWDRFDYSDRGEHDRWQIHPYNPANNVNYTFKESGFARRYPDHPAANKQPFFFTTPGQRDNRVVLKYQQRFVNRLLDDSLKYDHILYCMDNETTAEPEWGTYWAQMVKRRAKEAGQRVMVTEMWDDWDLTSARHRQTFDHPELYDFVDVSQNNQNSGQPHWDNFLDVRQTLSQQPRPINTTKTYGADGNKFGHSDQDAIERFWRHLLAGAASVRFHRPPAGLGINDKAVACIQAARKLEQRIELWTVDPANDLLGERAENEAYLAASKNRDTFALFFPAREKRGSVMLDLSRASGRFQIEWIHIDSGEWVSGKRGASAQLEGGQKVTITTPSVGNLVAVIVKEP